MNKKIDLNTLKPKLKNAKVVVGDGKLIVESQDGSRELVFPSEYKDILYLFDGNNTIKEIVSKIYELQGKVSFNAIITSLRLLKERDMIENLDIAFESLKIEKNPYEEKISLLLRPIFEFNMFNKLVLEPKKQILFLLLSFLIFILASLGIISSSQGIWTIDPAKFGIFNYSYAYAFFKFFAISSLLITLKTLVKMFLLMFCVGNCYKVSLRLSLVGFGLVVNDSSIYAHNQRSSILIYSFATMMIYIALALFFSFFFPQASIVNDFKIIALILTFIEMDPYRQSELTRLFNFFYADDQFKSVVPYLKNRSLTGLLQKSDKIGHELKLIAFSVLAIFWAVAFFVFTVHVIISSLPNFLPILWQYLLNQSNPWSMVSSFLMLSLLGVIFWYLFIDLAHTVYKNIVALVIKQFVLLFNTSTKYRGRDFTKEKVKEALKGNIFFHSFLDKTLEQFIQDGSIKQLKKGRKLIIQDTPGTAIYFLLSGRVGVEVVEQTGRRKRVVGLFQNSVIGELAVLKSCMRSADVIAEEDIVYLEIKAEVIHKLLDNPAFREDIDKMINRAQIAQFVSSAGLFKDFPPEVMNLFIDAGDLVKFPANQEIVTEGEKDKTFYLLIKGVVDVFKDSKKIATLKQGDFFGEIALIADVARTATVKTVEDCMFLYIEDKNFWKILSSNVELAIYIESVGQARMTKGQNG